MNTQWKNLLLTDPLCHQAGKIWANGRQGGQSDTEQALNILPLLKQVFLQSELCQHPRERQHIHP